MLIEALREWRDHLLGRGSAAITVPVMDGALKPNRALDEATLVAALEGIDDLASDGQQLIASAGPVLYRLEGESLVEWRRFDGEISAIAFGPNGLLAVAFGGHSVHLYDARGNDLARLGEVAGQKLQSANALAFDGPDALLVSDGSMQRGPLQWCHDLMDKGHSGRVLRWRFKANASQLLSDRQHYAFGVLPLGNGALLHSESWRHRIVRSDAQGRQVLLAELPGYPSRMTAAAGGGFWLTCFVCRTQLVEFVLREPDYRRRMMAEIDPRYWIAPALSSGQSFLEPLQGAGVKQMGVLKPWAPPRSYGLVIKVADDGRIERALHSQVDGRHHGITAVAEVGDARYVASKGSGRLLRTGAAA
jgi:hypothetical protein